MPNLFDQQVDALLWRHLFEMEAQRENDPGAAMTAPEEKPDAVFRRFRETAIPEKQFPVERPSLTPERCAEQSSIRFITLGHKALQVMAGNQFVMHRRARKMRIIPTHAHHLLFMRHGVGRI